MQEYSGLKPDWLVEIKALSRKKLSILLHESISKILLQVGSRDTRWQFFKVCWISIGLAFSFPIDIYHCLSNNWK